MKSDFSARAIERRREPRFRIEPGPWLKVFHDGLKWDGVLVDLSLGGMRLHLEEEAPAIADNLTVTHSLAGTLRMRQSWANGAAMGLQFDMPTDSKLARELRCVQLLLDDMADPAGVAKV